MAGLSYPALVFRSHRSFALFSALAAALLQFLVIRAITTIDTDGIASAVLAQLPERLRTVINETLISRMTLEGAAAFGLNHPILVVLVAINAIAVPARHVSGEIESGAMELLLAYPVSRVRLLLSLWVTSAIIGLVVVSGALLGSLAGVVLFHAADGSLAARLVEIAANLWLIALVMQTVALLASVWGTRGTKPAMWSAVALLSFYVLHFVTPLWEALDITTPFNIFSYYEPHKLVFGERSLGEHAAVLIGVVALGLGLAARRFHTRDIPG